MPAMLTKANLRQGAPGFYRNLMLAKKRMEAMQAGIHSWQVEKALDSGRICVDIDGRVGLGGLFNHAANALSLGMMVGAEVSIVFTNPLYMPTPRVDDWLDSYFLRLGPARQSGERVWKAGWIPAVPPLSIEQAGKLVWDYMQIRPEIVESVAEYGAEEYAAVHYRGSDKNYEASRVAMQNVFDCTRYEMSTRSLNRLYLASDEPSFIQLALKEFGDDVCFVLPQRAVASNGVPPHFANLPGQVKAIEALQTLLTLSRAAVCVRTPSFLSEWSQTLADQQHKSILVDT